MYNGTKPDRLKMQMEDMQLFPKPSSRGNSLSLRNYPKFCKKIKSIFNPINPKLQFIKLPIIIKANFLKMWNVIN